MSVQHIIRRTHLYLGLALLPWFLMYGFSSVFINHRPLADYYDDGVPTWTTRWERPAHFEVPQERSALIALGESVKDSLGVDNRVSVWPARGGGFRIDVADFTRLSRLTYDPERSTLTWEDRRFRFDTFWIVLHSRAGYRDGYLLNNLWALIVDIFSVASLAWIGTGIYMGWQLSSHRRWACLALSLGAVSFAVLMISF